MKKLVCVVGPTASGKSDLAIEIAKQVDGEVVSADSRQVYKGLDIGSGKITEKEMRGVPHHMLDVADPKDVFSVAEYKEQAGLVLESIWEKDKTPILCGGTGFYINTIVDNMSFPEVPPDEELRNKLYNKTLEELQDMLEKLDSDRFKTVDKQNPVRLIRAIEVATTLGKVPETETDPVDFDVLIIGIKTEKEVLDKRIHDRLYRRIKDGMIEEVEDLHKNGLSWERLEALGLEYRYVTQFLQEKLSKEEMLEKLEIEIRKYAKRQMTWFKRDERIKWFALEEKKEIINVVRNYV